MNYEIKYNKKLEYRLLREPSCMICIWKARLVEKDTNRKVDCARPYKLTQSHTATCLHCRTTHTREHWITYTNKYTTPEAIDEFVSSFWELKIQVCSEFKYCIALCLCVECNNGVRDVRDGFPMSGCQKAICKTDSQVREVVRAACRRSSFVVPTKVQTSSSCARSPTHKLSAYMG